MLGHIKKNQIVTTNGKTNKTSTYTNFCFNGNSCYLCLFKYLNINSNSACKWTCGICVIANVSKKLNYK